MFPGPAVDDDGDEEEGRRKEGRRKSMLGPGHGAHTCIRLPVPIAGEGCWKERRYIRKTVVLVCVLVRLCCLRSCMLVVDN